jgi:cold shock CspA family protein
MSALKDNVVRRKGVVKWFSGTKNYGFIAAASGDWFVHGSDVVEDTELREGEDVSFIEGQSRGRPCARQVMRL